MNTVNGGSAPRGSWTRLPTATLPSGPRSRAGRCARSPLTVVQCATQGVEDRLISLRFDLLAPHRPPESDHRAVAAHIDAGGGREQQPLSRDLQAGIYLVTRLKVAQCRDLLEISLSSHCLGAALHL